MPIKELLQKDNSDHSHIQDLLEKSIALSEEILEQNKKISRRLFFLSLGGYIKWALILIPIIIGIIYIPPFIEKLPQIISGLLSSVAGDVIGNSVNDVAGSSGLTLDKILRLLSN